MNSSKQLFPNIPISKWSFHEQQTAKFFSAHNELTYIIVYYRVQLLFCIVKRTLPVTLSSSSSTRTPSAHHSKQPPGDLWTTSSSLVTHDEGFVRTWKCWPLRNSLCHTKNTATFLYENCVTYRELFSMLWFLLAWVLQPRKNEGLAIFVS